ncbi:MAG: IS1380 family transposase [Planctomycetes bacterium]|nr:IS1380 family transposase [Planctomycetota bacterium]
MRVESRQSVLFEGLLDKPVTVTFTAPDQSSDGGVLLLKAIDEKMGLTRRMAGAMRDGRQPGKTEHALEEMFQERIFGISCGYPDGNDAARLSKDPAMQTACERRGEPLASQPTLSRLENAARSTDLLRMACALTDSVIERERAKRLKKRVRRITIDMDPTEDRTYGAQQLTFFNAFYDNWCYLPMVTTVQFDDEPEHYLIAPLLRPGNAKAYLGAVAVLKRLLPRLRKAFPKAKVFVRMDGGFAESGVLDWLDGARLGYAVNMPKNPVLKRLAAPHMPELRRRVQATRHTETVLAAGRYRAGKWSRERRVIVKAEVVALAGRDPRDNERFLITNLPWKPKKVYRFYALRGDAENRIKELKDGLRFDLTSCTGFRANQFRNLLAAAAYVLCQQLRHAARGTLCERAQVATLRERLLKLAVTIRETARRLWIEAPKTYAWMTAWRVIAWRVGAVPPAAGP